MLTGPAEGHMANLLLVQLLFLDAQDNTKDILSLHHARCGSVSAGLVTVDTMNLPSQMSKQLSWDGCFHGNHYFKWC